MTAGPGWRNVTLGELEVESGGVIQTGPFGSQLHASDYSSTGVPEGIARVSDEHVDRLGRHRLRPGDIVYSRRGDVEKCALVTTEQAGWLCGTGRLLVRVPGLTVDTRCLAYLLSLSSTRAWISQHAVGATMPNLNTGVLREVPVVLPPIENQRGIAATLGALDDKIESNLRQLRIADGLLQVLWSRTAAEASKTRRLADLVSTQYGLTASADAFAVGPKFLRVTDINKENWISWTSVPSVDIGEIDLSKYQLHKGDLLVARTADPGKSAIYDEASVEAVFASYLVRLRCPSYNESLYVYGFLKSSVYSKYAAGAMTGSVQKNMNARVIVDVDIPWPTCDQLDAFAAAASPLRHGINQRVSENEQLATLRDTLLPEVLSGRIRVAEAREVVEEAVG